MTDAFSSSQTQQTSDVQGQSLEGYLIPLRPLDHSISQERHQQGSNEVSLPPIDRGRPAWVFLACATTLEAIIWGLANSYGAFQDYHITSPQSPLHGKSSTITSAIGSIILAGNYFTPWLFSGLFTAFPHRIRLFSYTGIIFSSIGLIAGSFNPTPTSLIILQGFFSWGSSVFYLPAILWLPEWFDEKRGLATGVMLMGAGIGGVVWPFIISALLSRTGFGWTLRYLCLIQLILGVIISLFMKPRLSLSRANHSVRPRRLGFLRTLLPKHSSALNSVLGLITIILQILHAAAFRSISYYISPYATSLGLSKIFSTAILASLNAASAISYVLTGKLCDVLPHGIIVLLINTSATLLVGALFGLASTFALLLSFSILYGLFNGGFSTTMSPMARQMAKSTSSNSSPIFLEYLACRGAGGLVGPLVTSSLYKPITSSSTRSLWSTNAVYGSHGIGPAIIFVTVISGLNALLSITVVNFRSKPLASRFR